VLDVISSVVHNPGMTERMKIQFESSGTFEALSKTIFDPQFEADSMHRQFLQVWFVRLGVAPDTNYQRLVHDLFNYTQTGSPSPFLLELASENPYFIDWFGKGLVENPLIQNILSNININIEVSSDDEIPSFIQDVKSYIEPLKIADRLQAIVGEPYPKPERPVRYVISEYVPGAYNVYPDTIVHFKKDNPKWYIAGYGHEAGHLLTWNLCTELSARKLCGNERTRGVSELIAVLLNKLLLDAYDIECNEVFEECESWDTYMYEKNPGKPLFDAMINEIQLDSYSCFRDECIRLVEMFQ
jgi:hypothetical protein